MYASYRYRCRIPSVVVQQLGYTSCINSGDTDIYVFSKPELDLDNALGAKEHGRKIVADIGDNHFDHKEFGPIYKKLLEIADAVVCPTEIMQRRLGTLTNKEVTVIGDPYEMDEAEPHAEGPDLLWFGHQVNLEDIRPYEKIETLEIVTGPDEIENTTLWSPESVVGALERANKVLLPTRKWSAHKSPNRLINAIRSGCFPICDPHPAYREFRGFVWTGAIWTGLRWADHFEADLNELVCQAQQYVEAFYSPKVIGQKWVDFLDSI